MLTEEDIQKLSTILATKDDINSLRTYTETGFSEVRSDITSMKGDIDALRTNMQLGFSEIKEEISDLRESVQISLVASDKTAKVTADLQEEYHIMSGQLTNHDGTIRELAKKADVALSY